MIASDQKIFLRLKHTILLNILLVNVLLLVTLVIYSRSWRFIATREPETWKSHKLCERAENFGSFASKTYNSSQSVNNILLVKIIFFVGTICPCVG